MMNENLDVYAQFLSQCKEVIGTFDLERLAFDEQYKAEFFDSVALSADDELFEMAALVNSKLDEEMFSAR